MARYGFVDNDVFFKLICCDLWTEAVTALELEQVYRLPSAGPGPRGLRRLLAGLALPDDVKAQVADRIAQVAVAVPEIPLDWAEAAQVSAIHDRLLGLSEVDTGELLLLCVAIEAGAGAIVLSHDKRFMTALREHAPDVFRMALPYLVTFEHCLLEMSDRFGFDLVKERILPVVGCDGMLCRALSDGSATTEAHFRAAILSYGRIDR